jgi:DNA-binding transcriptional regulator YiaG
LINFKIAFDRIAMPSIDSVLKTEISRLARREVRHQTTGLHKASAGYRRDIAALKRQVSQLDRALKQLTRQAQKSTSAPSPNEGDKSLRFVAKGFLTLRKRLGVSAEQMGKLLGVSGQSVYAWETKRTVPRKSQLPAIASLRGLGKREVLNRLEELDSRPRGGKKT